MNKFLTFAAAIYFSLPLFAQSKFLECVTAFEKEEYSTAFNCLCEYIEKQPDNANALYYRARVWYMIEEYEAAVEDLDAAIEHHSEDDAISLNRLYLFRGQNHEAMDDYDAAMSDYKQAAGYNPNDTDAWFQQAELYSLLDNYTASDVIYLHILKIDGTSLMASVGLARNHIFKGNYEQAIEALDSLAQKYPSYSIIYRFRSYAYEQNGAYKKAIDDLIMEIECDEAYTGNEARLYRYASYEFDYTLSGIDSMLASGKDESLWLGLRAGFYWQHDMCNRAIDDYNRLENILPELTNDFYLRRGNCYERIKEYDKAIADFNRGIEIDEDSYLYVCLANAKRLKGDYHAAIADFTSAIMTDSTNCLAYYLRGKSKNEINDNRGAVEDYSAAIVLDEDDDRMYMERGRLYREKLNEPVLAEQDFLSALNLDKPYRKSGNERQFALFFLGDMQEAIACQDTILKQYPTMENYYDAARIYSLSGREQEALAFLRTAIEMGFSNFSRMENDSDLGAVRKLPEFINLLNQ